jgi:hypothetical protein
LQYTVGVDEYALDALGADVDADDERHVFTLASTTRSSRHTYKFPPVDPTPGCP